MGQKTDGDRGLLSYGDNFVQLLLQYGTIA